MNCKKNCKTCITKIRDPIANITAFVTIIGSFCQPNEFNVIKDKIIKRVSQSHDINDPKEYDMRRCHVDLMKSLLDPIDHQGILSNIIYFNSKHLKEIASPKTCMNFVKSGLVLHTAVQYLDDIESLDTETDTTTKTILSLYLAFKFICDENMLVFSTKRMIPKDPNIKATQTINYDSVEDMLGEVKQRFGMKDRRRISRVYESILFELEKDILLDTKFEWIQITQIEIIELIHGFLVFGLTLGREMHEVVEHALLSDDFVIMCYIMISHLLPFVKTTGTKIYSYLACCMVISYISILNWGGYPFDDKEQFTRKKEIFCKHLMDELIMQECFQDMYDCSIMFDTLYYLRDLDECVMKQNHVNLDKQKAYVFNCLSEALDVLVIINENESEYQECLHGMTLIDKCKKNPSQPIAFLDLSLSSSDEELNGSMEDENQEDEGEYQRIEEDSPKRGSTYLVKDGTKKKLKNS